MGARLGKRTIKGGHMSTKKVLCIMFPGIIAVLFLVVGCTTIQKAGPFVTNISSDGSGGVIVEKCYLSITTQTGPGSNSGPDYGTTDCREMQIKLWSSPSK